MPLFPESTLAAMRAMNEGNLPHSGQVYRNGSGYGPGGVVTEGWGAHGNPLKCRAIPVNTSVAAERVTADQVEVATRFTVAFPAGADIMEADRIVVTGEDPNGSAWELRLEVLAVSGPRASEVLRKVAGERAQFNPAEM